jgi:MFS family permease
MTSKYARTSGPRGGTRKRKRHKSPARPPQRANTLASSKISGGKRRLVRRLNVRRLVEPPAPGFRASPWLLLRNRDFRRYFLSSTCSNAGTWLQSTAQVIIAFQLTGSVFFVGVIVALQFAGVPLLSPVAAVLASRFNGRRVLVATQAGSALVAVLMACCFALGALNPGTLAAGALLLGVGYSLALPVQVTLVPILVRPEHAEAALRMNSASYNSGRALAPALSVLIIATIGAGWVFALNAVSFAVFAIAIPRLKATSRKRARAWLRSAPQAPARITDGVSIALRQRRILLLLAFVAAITLADDPVQVLSPSLASSMNLSHDWTGLFIAALGWGAVAGSLWPKTFSRPDVQRTSREAARHASKRAAWGLLALAVSVFLYGLGLSPFLSLLFAFCTGVAALIAGTAAQTPIIVRDHRDAASVGALWAIAWAGTKPVASLLDGWLAGAIGIRAAVFMLVLPAGMLALCELYFPPGLKNWIKSYGKPQAVG